MGGGRTSLGGQLLEDVIRSLKLKDFAVLKYSEYHKFGKSPTLLEPPSRMLIKRYPYTTIFGTQGYREYYVLSVEWSGELECKFQNGSGSTDEKFLYVSETLRRSQEQRMAVVHAGHWWKDKRGKHIIEWAKDEAKRLARNDGKELLILDFDGFINWAHRTWK